MATIKKELAFSFFCFLSLHGLFLDLSFSLSGMNSDADSSLLCVLITSERTMGLSQLITFSKSG